MNNHQKTKKNLKIIGIILVIVGGICAITGFVDFFIAANSQRMPQLFFLCFIGLPTLGIGASILTFAFRGEIMRYNKNESVPIINEASEEIKPAVHNVVSAVKNSLNDATITCSCGPVNDKNTKFCKKCGKELLKTCPSCGKNIENDSTFCPHCGAKIM